MTKAIKNELQARQSKSIETPGKGMSAPQIAFGILSIITIMAFIVG